MLSTSKFDSVNKNNSPLCHAVGCRKHVRLRQCHRGLFCFQHMKELDSIRDIINECKKTEDIATEIQYREKEMLFRKEMDTAHVRYLLRLSKNIDCQVTF